VFRKRRLCSGVEEVKRECSGLQEGHIFILRCLRRENNVLRYLGKEECADVLRK
jgi:hypothetical protein